MDIVDPSDSTLVAVTGRSFTLKCIGHNRSALRWFHNDVALSATTRLRITTSLDLTHDRMTSLLTRDAVGEGEGGAYRCADVREGVEGRASDVVVVRVDPPQLAKRGKV